jgi:hypothetical protein
MGKYRKLSHYSPRKLRIYSQPLPTPPPSATLAMNAQPGHIAAFRFLPAGKLPNPRAQIFANTNPGRFPWHKGIFRDASIVCRRY